MPSPASINPERRRERAGTSQNRRKPAAATAIENRTSLLGRMLRASRLPKNLPTTAATKKTLNEPAELALLNPPFLHQKVRTPIGHAPLNCHSHDHDDRI